VPEAVHDRGQGCTTSGIASRARRSRYGIDDLAADEGPVKRRDRPWRRRFAVASIRGWWSTSGPGRYPAATSLTPIIPDCGGSNGIPRPPIIGCAFGLLACGAGPDDVPGQVAALQPGDEPGAGVELPAPQAMSG
jgi:Rhodopirellula transposase DDE domain